MNKLNMDEVKKYADEGIAGFYQQRMKLLQDLTFHELLGKGFCLFRPMRPALAGDIVEVLLDAFLCSSGEQLFESGSSTFNRGRGPTGF